MNDPKTETFVALCVAMVEEAKAPTDETWRAMRAAQDAAERAFSGWVAFDVPWHAAQALCTKAGLYTRFDRQVPKTEHDNDLYTMHGKFSDAVWAANVAVRKAMEAK